MQLKMHTTSVAAVRSVVLSIFGIGLSMPLVAQKPSDRSLCRCDSAASCDAEGARALSKGDALTAMRCFRTQVGYAEDAKLPERIVSGYNNMSQTYVQNRDYRRALSWTHLALRVNPRDRSAKRALSLIQKHLSAWPTNLIGIYVRYAGRGLWDTLCLTEAPDSKIHLRLVAFRVSSAWRECGPAAYGDIVGDAALTRQGSYLLSGFEDFPDCRVSMSFKPGVATVTEPTGECGFGLGVRAGGRYERISSTMTNLDQCVDLKTP